MGEVGIWGVEVGGQVERLFVSVRIEQEEVWREGGVRQWSLLTI